MLSLSHLWQGGPQPSPLWQCCWVGGWQVPQVKLLALIGVQDCSCQPHQGCICGLLCGAGPAGSVCDGGRGVPPTLGWAQRKWTAGVALETLWDWLWTLVPFMPLPRLIETPCSSGLLEAGSQSSSGGPGRGGAAGAEFLQQQETGTQGPGLRTTSRPAIQQEPGVGAPTLVTGSQGC